jgi:hypothetical protein
MLTLARVRQSPRGLCQILAAAAGLALLFVVFITPKAPPSFAAAAVDDRGPLLRLDVVDAASGKSTPARFSLVVDGVPYHPLEISTDGLRFVSIHEARKQILTVTYTRGDGPVEVRLPPTARKAEVHATKGLEFRPTSITREVSGPTLDVKVPLGRWTNITAHGWAAADAHVHFDRLNRAENRDWFAMMAADDLAHLHFMMLKGGKVPGEWARQYAYGRAGDADDGTRFVTAGEEYRDNFQGHINLLGLGEIIAPIMAGTRGAPDNYPPLHTVLLRARELDGLPGVAHGGSLGRESTAALDTILGAVDFVEIGNAHLYSLDLWYRLLNCGYHLPPTAGTDLPNYPARDHWQPFLGGMRMYAQVGGRRDFESWKNAVKAGRTFVTSGPLLSLKINGHGLGETIALPASGGDVEIEAEAATPVGLRKFELIHNGRVLRLEPGRSTDDGVTRWRLRHRVRVTESGWFAVRCEGVPIQALREVALEPVPWHRREAVAHTAAMRVLAGGQPIRSTPDADWLIAHLERQKAFYRENGKYADEAHRKEVAALFDRGLEILKRQRPAR